MSHPKNKRYNQSTNLKRKTKNKKRTEKIPKTNKLFYIVKSKYLDNKWVKKTSNSKSGAHCIIFTKASINTILTYMKTHTIKLAVDELLYTLHENKVITAYDWGNNVLDESQMFCGLFKQKDNHFLDQPVLSMN